MCVCVCVCFQGFLSVLIQHYGAITTCQDVNSRRVIITGHSNTTQMPLGAASEHIHSEKEPLFNYFLAIYLPSHLIFLVFPFFYYYQKHDYFSS